MRLQDLVLAVVLLSGLGGALAEPACQVDRTAMLALDPATFDSTFHQGWRVLGDEPGCEHQAAVLLADYRAAHPQLPEAQQRELRWHEGQMRAAAGESISAIALFASTQPREGRDEQLYVDATLAYMRRDRPAVERARRALARVPQPEWFQGAADRYFRRYGRRLAWPPTLAAVDNLLACFDYDYRSAYGGACRPVGDASSSAAQAARRGP